MWTWFVELSYQSVYQSLHGPSLSQMGRPGRLSKIVWFPLLFEPPCGSGVEVVLLGSRHGDLDTFCPLLDLVNKPVFPIGVRWYTARSKWSSVFYFSTCCLYLGAAFLQTGLHAGGRYKQRRKETQQAVWVSHIHIYQHVYNSNLNCRLWILSND